MSVKAVHIEVVTELSTEAFLAALDRFVGRRGYPSDIYSDNGTNFVGAERQLKMIVSSEKNRAALAKAVPSVWHFNPPNAPHFGEFTTIIIRIESILNSRPLSPLSSDPHDLQCLTPGHFLIGEPLLAVPELDVSESSVGLIK
ncbi:uncharacterized protein LOC126895388 [Daktulosphaira vitifoliae]|uniref:uncharacterized protein LOC126895388 n=1 Tax=Daktulosphaira vitifoliae TaxID=58002 RepID=UPI0021A9CAF3|nr:uncharacterized protein LOC126895388 [Daktulosphaira vitifoliae]